MKRRLASLAVGLVLAACSSGGDPTPSASNTTPPPTTTTPAAQQSAGDILVAAAQAATAKGWVHTVATAKHGSETATTVNDTGPDRGRQTIEVAKQRIEILLVSKLVYMRANEAALRDFFQFPPNVASKYANKWLSFTESDPGYGDLAETLDMPSLVENIVLTGNLTKTSPTTIAGTSVVGVKGDHPQGGTGTLYVAALGEPLPVKLETKDPESTTSVVFSNWGKAVTVTAPSDHTPFSELQG